MDADLTGWTPHTGEAIPEDDNCTPETRVIVLMRGRSDTGPREAGPGPARAFIWTHAAGELRPETASGATTQIIADEQVYAPGDVIGWAYADALPAKLKRYPHIRADMGMGVRS